MKEKLKRESKDKYSSFCRYVDDDFSLKEQFHKTYYKILDMWAKGKIPLLMVSVPSQHGKSEGSTRKLPAYILGRDPNKKVAIGSYSATFAEQFNSANQLIIDTDKYRDVFPKTKLAKATDKNVKRTTQKFDIVGTKGFLKAVGRGGPLTGDPVDDMIMDDLYSSEEEGNSPVIQEKVISWYTSVVRKRLHNDSKQLMVFTRWSENDLIGYVESKEPVINATCWDDFENVPEGTWIKVNFQALKEGDATELDPREEGEALWESKHSAKKHRKDRAFDPMNFEKMSQGNPTPKEGFLYDVDKFKTYKELPTTENISNYTDTADKGKDYLCSICYVEYENKAYVTDILFTTEPMAITEDQTAKMLTNNNVRTAIIESNNGGEGFARNVDRLTGINVSVETFHQSGNKESRINSNSASVQNNIVFPFDWKIRFPLFYNHVKMYKADFKTNKHDDGPDTMTGVIETIATEDEDFDTSMLNIGDGFVF